MTITQTRRRFLTTLSLAGTAGLIRAPRVLAAEEALETTSVRLMRIPTICLAPQYVAEELLRAEGFSDVHYVDAPSSAEFPEAIASSKTDFTMIYASPLVAGIDSLGAITALAGLHVGCLELFGHEAVRNIADLKGKTLGLPAMGSTDHLFVSVLASHILPNPLSSLLCFTTHSP